jgi:hypothetical protein
MEEVFYIQLVCPNCHRSKWVLVRASGVTREDLLNTSWEFACPVHGSLSEKPLQAHQKVALPFGNK